MHQGRMRLRPWLEEQIRSGRYPGVTWLDETAGVFQIPWKHAARHGWNIDKDATLFRNWAMHTGRYKPGIDKPDPKTWKANFRCALNSLPDVKELHDRSTKKGNNAFRVYMLLPSIKTPKRRRGLRESDLDMKFSGSSLFSYSDTVQAAPLEHFPDAFSRYREGEAACSPGFRCHRDSHSSAITMEGSQDYFFTPLPLHSDPIGNMHSPAASNEHTQAVLKIVEHLKNAEHWNQSNDNTKSWTSFYDDGMDHSGALQTEYHAYGGQQRPFFHSH